MTKQNKAILICTECLNRNYQVSRSTQTQVRLELKKHCKTCNKHTLHKESR